MIYLTATQNCQEVASLLKEWTKHDYSEGRVLWNSLFIVARDDDRRIGCAQLILIDDPFWDRRYGLVENVYVTPKYRRQGVGKQLMEYITSQAALFGCEFVKLTSAYDKKEAHGLYKSLGFKDGLSFKKSLK